MISRDAAMCQICRTVLAVVCAVSLSACESEAPTTAEKTVATAMDQPMAFATSLFTGIDQTESFNRIAEFFPVNEMTASPEPWSFDEGDPMELPQSFVYHDREITTSDFLDLTDTSALLVIKDGQIIYENYWLTGGPDVHWMSFSVGKSFVSALVGIALDEGLFESVDEQIVDYVPELTGSAYDGARIKDVLQMSSGARWNEDYSDPDSDINRYVRAIGGGGSLDEFTASLDREHQPGTVNYYNSSDTQALGMLLSRVTGKSLAAYAEEKLWHPLGMERNGYWMTDKLGVEVAVGGLQLVARDYAKFGQLYLNNGNWNGRQIISEQWVQDSLEMDGPHLQPGASDPEYPVGYGYQWWILDGDEDEFSAIGVYNQFIYIAPRKNLVIVKLSAFQEYATSLDPEAYLELESIELFRAIAAKTTS